MMISWSGDPKACDRIKDANTRYSCRGRASLVAALRAPAQCAASPSCQVLVTKSHGACEPLRVNVSRTLCARVAKDLAAEKNVAAREQERLRQAAQQAKDKAEKLAVAAAAGAAQAAQQAEADAIAKAKAAVAAEQEKVAKQAADQAAKAAAAAAAVRAKADAEARKAAAAKAQIAKQEKEQFQKGEPMQKMPVEAAEVMKAIEEGRPIPKPKPEPKKKAGEESVPSEP
jgi:colicin import membrane protein